MALPSFLSPLTSFGSFFGSSGSNNPLFGDNGLFSNPTGAWDKFKNGDTNTVNKQIADENLQYQYDNLNYLKELQQTIFNREDSAYQRTVNDMRAAGLSPLTMQSQNGAGEAIQTEAPQNGFRMQDKGVGEVLSGMLGLLNSKQDYDIGKEQQRIQAATADSAETDALFNKLSFANRLANSDYDTMRNFYSLQDAQSAADYNKTFGFNSSMSPEEKMIFILGKQFGLFKDDEPYGSPRFVEGHTNEHGTNMPGMNFYRSFLTPDEIKTKVSDYLKNIKSQSSAAGKDDFKSGIFDRFRDSIQRFNPFGDKFPLNPKNWW